MGNRLEVWAYRPAPTAPLTPLGGYQYESVYRGESWLRALWAAVVAKRTCGCVKIEWR